MEVPIPSDWDGESWFCLKLQWPDSPEFFGLLAGLLTMGTRGRYWDGKTGSIKSIQELFWQIFDRNVPYNECGVCDNGDGMVVIPIGGLFDMTCTLPYGSIRVDPETGKLQYKTCDGWVDVANWDLITGVNPPPDDNNTDPTEGYSCNKARGMAVLFAIAANDILDALTNATSYYQRQQAVWQVIQTFGSPQVTAATIIQSWSQDAPGIYDALTSDDFESYLACIWDNACDDTGDLSADEFARMTSLLRSKYSLLVSNFLSVCMEAVQFVNFRWWAQASYDTEATCQCPDEPQQTAQSANGWYWQKDDDYDFTYEDNFVNTFVNSRILPGHDVYGVTIRINSLSSPADLNKYKRSNDAQDIYDVYMFGINSDSWYGTYSSWHCQVDPDIATEVLALLDGAALNASPQFASSETLNAPSAKPGEIALATYNFGSASGDHTGTCEVWWLYNINSPSHTGDPYA